MPIHLVLRGGTSDKGAQLCGVSLDAQTLDPCRTGCNCGPWVPDLWTRGPRYRGAESGTCRNRGHPRRASIHDLRDVLSGLCPGHRFLAAARGLDDPGGGCAFRVLEGAFARLLRRLDRGHPVLPRGPMVPARLGSPVGLASVSPVCRKVWSGTVPFIFSPCA